MQCLPAPLLPQTSKASELLHGTYALSARWFVTPHVQDLSKRWAQVQPVQWRSMDSLQSLLTCSGHLGSTLYYRILDMPLSEWESMKTVKVRCIAESTSPTHL